MLLKRNKDVVMKGKKTEPVRKLLFRVSPEGMPSIWRIIEVTEKQTLHAFLKALHNTLELAFPFF
jgi:hypothetical protein